MNADKTRVAPPGPMLGRGLSERALILLKVVDDHTDRDWSTGEIRLFYVPRTAPHYVNVRGQETAVHVSGAGDVAAFKALVRRGLIERPRTAMRSDYLYAITEDGRRVLEDHREMFPGGYGQTARRHEDPPVTLAATERLPTAEEQHAFERTLYDGPPVRAEVLDNPCQAEGCGYSHTVRITHERHGMTHTVRVCPACGFPFSARGV
jgi:hypothetical protein